MKNSLFAAALALAAFALTACGDDSIRCDDGRSYEPSDEMSACEQLNAARIASGSGTQSSASLELCWEQHCDDEAE